MSDLNKAVHAAVASLDLFASALSANPNDTLGTTKAALTTRVDALIDALGRHGFNELPAALREARRAAAA